MDGNEGDGVVEWDYWVGEWVRGRRGGILGFIGARIRNKLVNLILASF